MSQAAHLYRNGDGSLKHRIDMYLEALEARQNIKNVKGLLDDPDLADIVGHQEDVEQAEVILENSILNAVAMIDQNEIKQALSLGMVSEAQAWEFSHTKQKIEADQQSDKQKKSKSRRK